MLLSKHDQHLEGSRTLTMKNLQRLKGSSTMGAKWQMPGFVQDDAGGNREELNLRLSTLPRSPAPGGGTTHSCQGRWRCHSPQRSLPCSAGPWGPRLLLGWWCCPVSCRSDSGCPRLQKKTGETQSPSEPCRGCRGVVWPRQRSVGHLSPIPNRMTWELSPTKPVYSLQRYCDQDTPICVYRRPALGAAHGQGIPGPGPEYVLGLVGNSVWSLLM